VASGAGLTVLGLIPALYHPVIAQMTAWTVGSNLAVFATNGADYMNALMILELLDAETPEQVPAMLVEIIEALLDYGLIERGDDGWITTDAGREVINAKASARQ
jgi:hypothetical protein